MPVEGPSGTAHDVNPTTDDLALRLLDDRSAWRRVLLAGATTEHRIDDLALLAGLSSAGRCRIDGRPVAGSTPLVEAGLRCGSSVRFESRRRSRPSDRPLPDSDAPALVRLVVVAGLDLGRSVELPAGRHVLGSSPTAGCRVHDPSVAAHHALIDVAPGPTVTVTDLGVGRPITAAGQLRPGDRIDVGGAVVELADPAGLIGAIDGGLPGDGWRLPLIRRARSVTTEVPPLRTPAPIDPSDPVGPSSIGLITTAASLAGGIVAAILFRQPMLLLLSGIGTIAALATSGAQWWRSVRRRNAERARWEVATSRFELAVAALAERERHRLRRPMPWSGDGERVELGPIWQRRGDEPSAWEVLVGHGTFGWRPPVDGDVDQLQLEHVGVPLALAPGAALAIVGSVSNRQAAARSVVVQLACALGPADLRVAVVAPEERVEQWVGLRWLPHTLDPDGEPMIVASGAADLLARRLLDDEDRRPLLLVVDGGDHLATRTAAVRRLLDHPELPTSTIVVDPAGAPIHASCGTLLRIADGGAAELHRFDRSSTGAGIGPIRLHAGGLAADLTSSVAGMLAGWSDPELAGGGRQLPATVGLLELHGAVDRLGGGDRRRLARRRPGPASERADRSRRGTGSSSSISSVTVRTRLIAGTTGAGKSELLRTLVAALAVGSAPDVLSLLLIDYKGGSVFDVCSDLAHVVGVVTDLDHRLGGRVLASLDAELRRRERALRIVGAADLAAYRRLPGHDPIARLVVIVDEFAALAAELPEFLHALVAVAQRGRSLGVHLVLATQRPAGVVDDDIRANTNLRIALRVQDPADSLDVLGDRAAVRLPRCRPGRAIVRLGPGELLTFQAARCDDAPVVGGLRFAGDEVAPTPIEGRPAELIQRLVDAAHLAGHEELVRPWLEPLPPSITASEPDELGWIDDVAVQQRRPLRWERTIGNLAVIGALGAGTTHALARLATVAAVEAAPDRLHLHVLDAAGTGELASLAALPHCVAVVDGRDRQRLSTLVDRLSRSIAAGPAGDGIERMLLIDGAGTLRAMFAEAAMAEVADRFDRLVADGGRAGLRIAFAADRPGALPLSWLSQCPSRWIGRLADPSDASILGLPAAAALRSAPAGRFVVELIDGCPLDAQLVVDRDSLATQCESIATRWAGVAGPAPLPRLPSQVTVGLLPAPVADGALRLPLGLAVGDAFPISLELHDGDHLLVAGAARSGRSSLLALLAEQWSQARPDGWVGVLDARHHRSKGAAVIEELSRQGPGRPALLLVDDADRWDDPGGALAGLLATDRAELHIVASGRPEALRAAGYGHWTSLRPAEPARDSDRDGRGPRRRRARDPSAAPFPPPWAPAPGTGAAPRRRLGGRRPTRPAPPRTRRLTGAAIPAGSARMFGPGVFRITAGHLLAHLVPRAAPEAGEVVGDLHRTPGRGEQVDHETDPSVGDGGGCPQPEQVLDPGREYRPVA